MLRPEVPGRFVARKKSFTLHATRGTRESEITCLTTRTTLYHYTTLTTVTSALLIALFGFSISRFDAHKTDTLFVTAVVGIFYLFIMAITLFLNIRPSAYFSVGAEPKDFFNRALINKNNSSYRMIAFYINETHEYQKRILYNKFVNSQRWKLYKISLIMLVLTPIVLSLVYWMLTIF